MSPSKSNKRQPVGQGPGGTAHPTAGARAIRTTSLWILVGVVFIVALLMVISLVEFVLKPDPAVKAGPMYVTLTLTTAAALLMLFMALNASFLPFMPRERARNVSLVMWVMGVTGIVTGLLTVGGAAGQYATRLVLASVAFMFIMMQNTRLAQARAAARAGQAGPFAGQPDPSAAKAQPRPRSRQRRAGRKH
jgi:hypothetical protein